MKDMALKLPSISAEMEGSSLHYTRGTRTRFDQTWFKCHKIDEMRCNAL